MKNLCAFLVTSALLASAGCATVDVDSRPTAVAPLLSGLEIAPIEFKSGLPVEGATVENSIEDGIDEVLAAIATELIAHPHMQYSLLGFTDDQECRGRECNALSLRRAQLVHDWLLAHDVPTSSLAPPQGFGNAMPTGDNKTEAGRAQNRRVELSYVPKRNED